MKFLPIVFLFVSFNLFGQKKGDNTIVVHGVSFLEVCNKLLDAGYIIEKKDNELQTAKTEIRDYEKDWNASYIVNVRCKDSTAYLSATFTAPGRSGALFKDEKASIIANNKGKVQRKALSGYPLLVLYDMALTLGKPVEFARF